MPELPFTVRAQVIDAASSDGISGLVVRVFDADPGRPGQLLGERVTREDGTIEVHFSRSAAGGRNEGAPEVYAMVYAADGTELLYQSPWMRMSEEILDLGSITLGATGGTVARPPGRPTSIGGPGVSSGVAPLVSDPSDRVGSASVHGRKTRDFVAPRSPFYQGPFGRLFRGLPPWTPPGASDAEKEWRIRDIAATMSDDGGDAPGGDNPTVPSGYTYFGQFVDHDVTFDPSSSLTKLNDPDRLENFRTPRFDLDSLYGGGPDDEPFLYDGHSGRLLTGKGRQVGGVPAGAVVDLCALAPTDEDDLPRNQQGTALLGDPRNDENVIVSQFQLAFLKFHNRVLEFVTGSEGLTGREAFHRAQQLVRWHYQWVVLRDFLPRLAGETVVNDILFGAGQTDPPYRFDMKFYKWKLRPFMPVEFSAAAYRLGHSMIRSQYDLNHIVTGTPIFRPPSTNPGPLADLRGGRPLPQFWTLDWRRFLSLDPDTQPQLSRRIDTRLSAALSAIPAGPGQENPLALLNLLRGWRLALPSGQAVARAMGVRVRSNEDLGLDIAQAGHEAPLWYYILKEAELEPHQGERLGPVGARIIAEVFVGLAKGDPSSFVNIDPRWTPDRATKEGRLVGDTGRPLELADILRFAGLGGALPF